MDQNSNYVMWQNMFYMQNMRNQTVNTLNTGNHNPGIPNMAYGMMQMSNWNNMSARRPMPSAGQSYRRDKSAAEASAKRLAAAYTGRTEVKKIKEENAWVLDPARYKETNISQSDLSKIVALYGNDIENIYNLSPGQRWMFDNGHTEKKVQLMQFVCRAKVAFDPPRFRQRVHLLVNKHDNLRTAFVYRNLEQPYKVVLKGRSISYILRTFENTVETEDEENINRLINSLLNEDRQRGFDLEYDPLVRIMVCRLKENDYIFFISQPHINTDGYSMGMLLKELFMDYALELNGIDVPTSESSYREYARYMMGIDKEKQLLYWQNKLDGFTGECRLPGHMTSKEEYYASEYVVNIDKETYRKLNKLQFIYKTSLFNILQSAWAIVLSRITGSNDILFGTVISGRHADVAGSLQTLGGFAEMVPVRVVIHEKESLGDLIKDLQLAMKQAEDNSDCTIKEIEDRIGRKTPLISHSLNFHNFAIPKVNLFRNGALKGFEFVSGSMQISNSDDLSLIFSKEDDKFLCDFHYNLNAYLPYTVMVTARYYLEVLKALTDAWPTTTVESMPHPDLELFEVSKEAYDFSNLKTVMTLRKKELFSELDFDDLVYMVEKSKVVGFMDGSRIIDPEEELDFVPVIVRGIVTTFNVDLVGESTVAEVFAANSIITCAGLFGGKSHICATARADNTQVLMVPGKIFIKVISKNRNVLLKLPFMMEKLIRHSYEIGVEEKW